MPTIRTGLATGVLTVGIICHGSTGAAAPVGMEILGSAYHLWGNTTYTVSYWDANGQFTGSEFLPHSYDLFSILPASQSLSEAYGAGAAFSGAGEFFVDAASRAYGNLGYPTPDGGTADYNPVYPNDAYAEATWTFRTDGSTLHLDLSPGYWDLFVDGHLWLNDLTTGAAILDVPYADMFGPEAANRWSIAIDPAHTYSMRMYGAANSNNDDYAVRLDTGVRVPEPGTLMLLGISVFGLFGPGVRFFVRP